jgi:glyoxylase I family protein
MPELDHVGLSVGDLVAAEAWYRAAFGYRREVVLRVDAIDLDIVMLIHPDDGHRLELSSC